MAEQAFKERKHLLTRNVLLLILGQAVSKAGDQLATIAFLWLIITLTGSAATLTGVLIAMTLPIVIFRFIGGVIIDRLNRKSLLITADLARGGLVFLLAALTFNKQVNFWYFVLIAFGLGIGEAIFTPVYNSLIPSIAEKDQLLSLNSLLQMGNQGSGMIIAAFSGVFIAFLGTSAALMLDGLSFFVSAISILFLTLPKITTSSRQIQPVIVELKEGFQVAFSKRVVLSIFIAAGLINFADALVAIYPLHIKEYLGAGVTWYGFLSAAVMVGLFSMNLLYTWIGKHIPLQRSLMLMAFIEGLGILIFGLSQNLVLDLLAFYLFGAGMAGFFATVVTLLQQETEEAVRGRIFSLYGVFAVSLMPVGYLLAGNLAKITTTSFVLSLAGVIILLTAFWLFLQGRRNGKQELPSCTIENENRKDPHPLSEDHHQDK